MLLENQQQEDEAPSVSYERRRGNRGCWGNYGAMCCQKKSLSQAQLYDLYADDK
jgi:hypothetical protein